MDEIVIKVDNVYKDFVLPHEKKDSVKGVFTGLFSKATSKKESQHALKGISFEIKKGEFFGIVGRNGSGKSTLLKILASIYQPTKGSIATSGKLVPFIELGVGFNPELTGRDNVYLNGAMLGFSVKEVDSMYDDIVSFSELERFMDQKLKNYSSGMQVRLAFSVAVKAQADILLVDEVLAVGDADFQRKCFAYFKTLKKDKKTVVFVTHDMNAVKEFCDRAILVDNSELQFMGNPYDVAREYNLLFMNQDKKTKVESNNNRWGTYDIKFKNVKAEIVGENLKVTASAKVGSKPIDGVLYGIHISSEDGSEITALNNRMINTKDIKDLSPDSIVEFEWNMLNIFNDGKYFVTLTLVNDEQQVLDWYTEADSFIVKKSQRSTTAVIPPVEVVTIIHKPRKDGHV